MARNTKPKCKQCRRIGESVCGTAKCALTRRNYPPGQNSTKRKARITEYGLQLREKQKAKSLYGLLERQFRKYYDTAARKTGNTGEILMSFLEKRFDNIVYRSGFGQTRRQARQLVTHAHFLVNGRPCNIPSRQLKAGDIITVKTSHAQKKYFTELQTTMKMHEAPAWLEVQKDQFTITLLSEPKIVDAEQSVAVNLIVEYYSR